MSRSSTGRYVEGLVADYLQQKGWKIIEQNTKHFGGEIDIIAQENNTIVAVEVKSIKATQGFVPEDHFTHQKAERVKRVFESYLAHRNWSDKECRVDLACVVMDTSQDLFRIRYYKNVST